MAELLFLNHPQDVEQKNFANTFFFPVTSKFFSQLHSGYDVLSSILKENKILLKRRIN